MNREIIGVKFKKLGKIYFFDPKKEKLNRGDLVIVETANGIEFAEVVVANKEMPEEKLVNPLKSIIRKANYKDIKHNEENEKKEKEAFKKAEELIKQHNLNMNLTEVEYTFDNSKLLFYFTADGRIDFRDLVKDLAAIYKTRIELRQIGVRDKAKEIGGLGPCGRPLCCSEFLTNFNSVSINMAKNQGIALNPTKINGACGRLLCCLGYEDSTYTEYKKELPKIGQFIEKNGYEGRVTELDVLNKSYKIKDDEGNEHIIVVEDNGSSK